MILTCQASAIPQFLPYVKKMVEVENNRGDNLQYEPLAVQLMNGQQKMALVYREEADTEPVMIFLYQEVPEAVRQQMLMVINNFFLPSKELLMNYDPSKDRALFKEFTAAYARVMFCTDNPAVVRLMDFLGLELKVAYTMYEFVRS